MPDNSTRREQFTATDAIAITTSDTVDLPVIPRALYVGGAGDISVVTAAGRTVVIYGAVAGSVIPLQVQRVNATGTTATNLLGLL